MPMYFSLQNSSYNNLIFASGLHHLSSQYSYDLMSNTWIGESIDWLHLILYIRYEEKNITIFSLKKCFPTKQLIGSWQLSRFQDKNKQRLVIKLNECHFLFRSSVHSVWCCFCENLLIFRVLIKIKGTKGENSDWENITYICIYE